MAYEYKTTQHNQEQPPGYSSQIFIQGSLFGVDGLLDFCLFRPSFISLGENIPKVDI